MTVSANLVLALAVPIFILAASLQRVYVANGRLALIVLALILFTVGNMLMIRVIRDMGLGVAISVATIAQFVLINIVAYAWFGERPTALQLAGMAFGAVGIVLIMLPRGSS